MLRSFALAAAAASAACARFGTALFAAASIGGLHHMGGTRYARGHDRSGRGFDPRINRWTGEPHQHQREISRRLRQRARAA